MIFNWLKSCGTLQVVKKNLKPHNPQDVGKSKMEVQGKGYVSKTPRVYFTKDIRLLDKSSIFDMFFSEV